MIRLSHCVFLAGFLGLAAFSLPAQTPDGTPPSGEDVCDELLEEGATPGLYGLCVAYCEAQDCDAYAEGEAPESCHRLQLNYERRAAESELPIPCEAEQQAVCPCWSAAELAAGGMGLPTTFPVSFCAFGLQSLVDGQFVPDSDFVSYSDGQQNVVFLTGPGVCFYRNTLTLDDGNPNSNDDRVEFGINAGAEQVCRDDIVLRSIDFAFCIGAP